MWLTQILQTLTRTPLLLILNPSPVRNRSNQHQVFSLSLSLLNCCCSSQQFMVVTATTPPGAGPGVETRCHSPGAPGQSSIWHTHNCGTIPCQRCIALLGMIRPLSTHIVRGIKKREKEKRHEKGTEKEKKAEAKKKKVPQASFR